MQVTATWPLSPSSKKNALGAKVPSTVPLVSDAAVVLGLTMKENIPDPSSSPTLLLPPMSDLKYLFTKLLQFLNSDKKPGF